MAKLIRVLQVDDHEIVRRGLRKLLELEPDIEVVGEATNGEEALRQVKLLSPDVVVMDIKMPGGNGLNAAKQLQKERFAGKVLLISMYEQYVSKAIEAGASGYLSKSAKLDKIVSAIRKVHGGGFVYG